MTRLAAAAMAAALMFGGATVALAQTQSSTNTPPAASKQPMHHPVAQRDTDRSGDRDTKALNLLEANGYTGIQQFQPAGKDFQALVTKNGKQMTVTVDPDAGTIQNRA